MCKVTPNVHGVRPKGSSNAASSGSTLPGQPVPVDRVRQVADEYLRLHPERGVGNLRVEDYDEIDDPGVVQRFRTYAGTIEDMRHVRTRGRCGAGLRGLGDDDVRVGRAQGVAVDKAPVQDSLADRVEWHRVRPAAEPDAVAVFVDVVDPKHAQL